MAFPALRMVDVFTMNPADIVATRSLPTGLTYAILITWPSNDIIAHFGLT